MRTDVLVRTPAASTADPATGATTACARVDDQDDTSAETSESTWGWLPALSLVSSLGLLLVSSANYRSRMGWEGADPFFWAGLLLVFVPTASRLVAAGAGRRERLGLVVVLGLTLYLVKVTQSPVAFTFPDEMHQLYNVTAIVRNHRLFEESFLLPVTPLYPGLATATAALVAVSGLGVFGAGLLVMGVARLILLLGLFLFYEQVGRSARIAGIAVALYMANPNYIFYSAEFSYEALAIPLAALVLFAVSRREREHNGRARLGLTVSLMAVTLAVVITHHMTAYALVVFLLGVSILPRRHGEGDRQGTWGTALLALVATLAWLGYVASFTIGYLAPVLGGAITSALQLLLGEQSGRRLFTSSSGAVAPLWERLFALGAVVLILLGLPFGVLRMWQRRTSPYAITLALTALAYFPMLGLRFTSDGWETSNRSSEFLFVGIAFVLALGITEFRVPRPLQGLGLVFFSAYVAAIFVGGSVTGWQPNVRLSRPFLVQSQTGMTVEPQGVTAARWAGLYLGPRNRLATDPSNAEMMLVYGDQEPVTGRPYGVQYMFYADAIDQGVLDTVRITQVRYLVVDRRLSSWDHLIGLYFARPLDASNGETGNLPRAAYTKFDSWDAVDRVFDNGTIAIYDLGVTDRAAATK